MSGMYEQYLSAKQQNDVQQTADIRRIVMDELMNRVMDKGFKGREWGTKNNPTLNPEGPYVHGLGGLLSYPGQSPAMLSSMIQPIGGMATRIPRKDDSMPVFEQPGSEWAGYDAPFVSILTGQTEGDLLDFSNQPEGPCDDAPQAGLLKLCTAFYPYGGYSGRLREINATRIGRLTNRGEGTDFSVVNQWATDSPFVPDELKRSGDWINREITKRLAEAGHEFQLLIAPNVYDGNPANNIAGNFSRQITGFNLIYITGRRDAISQNLCPAVDSLIVNFNANVASTDLFGRYLYQLLEDIYRVQEDLASDAGLMPVVWEYSMDRDLFYELTRMIPIQQYVRLIATVNAVNGTDEGAKLNLSGREEQAARDDMWNNRWLPIMGQRVRVNVEMGKTIGRTWNAATGTATSDIYLHPMSVRGGSVPTLFWEFINYDNADLRLYNQFITKGFTYVTDGGRFIWSSNFKNFCGNVQFRTEPRIVPLAPFLAARIRNVQYNPSLMDRSAYPTDTSFFVDGGRTQDTDIYATPTWTDSSIALFPTE